MIISCASQNQISLAPEAFGLQSASCRTVAHWGKRLFQTSNMKLSKQPDVRWKINGKVRREYRTWSNMKSRCLNPKNGRYHDYGGRGITICPRWLRFANFITDMGICPKGMTLDRIDNDGNYEPGNCRWATWIEQARNSRKNIWATIRGETKIFSEWCALFGISKSTASARLRRGWTKRMTFTVLPIRGTNQFTKRFKRVQWLCK